MKKLPRSLNPQILITLLMCTTVVLPNFVTASDEINLAHQQVIDAAEKFVLAKLGGSEDDNLQVKASPLDSRIEIPLCAEPYQMSASNEALQQSNVTVRASCPSSNWYLYMMVKAKEMQRVVVLSSAVSPGTLITTQHVKLVELDKKLIRSAFDVAVDGRLCVHPLVCRQDLQSGNSDLRKQGDLQDPCQMVHDEELLIAEVENLNPGKSCKPC